MRKYLIMILLPLLIYSCGTTSKVNRADQPWSYEVESVGVGADGTYVLRIWTYWRTPDLPIEEAKKNAVHAVIFRGIPAGNGATAQPALRSAQLTPGRNSIFRQFLPVRIPAVHRLRQLSHPGHTDRQERIQDRRCDVCIQGQSTQVP